MAMFRPDDRFYEKRGHVWVSPGLTPIMGSKKNPAPHPSLPVEEYNFTTKSSYVIPQGTFVGKSEGYMIPSTREGFSVTYDGQDVFAGVAEVDGSKVAIGDIKAFAAAKPVGMVIWDILQNPMTLPNDFQTHLTQTAPTFRTEGVVVLPIVYKKPAVAGTPADGLEKYADALYNFEVGDIIAPDFGDVSGTDAALLAHVPTTRPGGVRKFLGAATSIGTGTVNGFTDTIPADTIAERVGRIIAVETENEFSRQGLELVRSDEVDVQSEATHGFPRHIWNAFKATRTDSTIRNDYFRKIIFVNIDCR